MVGTKYTTPWLYCHLQASALSYLHWNTQIPGARFWWPHARDFTSRTFWKLAYFFCKKTNWRRRWGGAFGGRRERALYIHLLLPFKLRAPGTGQSWRVRGSSEEQEALHGKAALLWLWGGSVCTRPWTTKTLRCPFFSWRIIPYDRRIWVISNQESMNENWLGWWGTLFSALQNAQNRSGSLWWSSYLDSGQVAEGFKFDKFHSNTIFTAETVPKVFDHVVYDSKLGIWGPHPKSFPSCE